MSGFVGVFDSGVGGISVLRSLVAELPHEDFHYFGDSANAPYGEKTEARVLELSRDIVGRFVADGAKAIAIACNTATSAAAPTLRRIYPAPAHHWHRAGAQARDGGSRPRPYPRHGNRHHPAP